MKQNTKERTYSITELAKEFGITTRTMRFYEEKGLLRPKRKGQTRIYTAKERTRLKLILRGKRLGFSLEEAREIIDLYKPGQDNVIQIKQLFAVIDRREKKLLGQKKDIEHMLGDLEAVRQKVMQSVSEEVRSQIVDNFVEDGKGSER